MRKIFLLLFAFCSISCEADQLPAEIISHISASLKPDYSENDLFSFFEILDEIEVKMFDSVELRGSMLNLKNNQEYKFAISKNISSKNIFQRTIAYRLVGLAGDSTFAPLLCKRLLQEDTLASVWAFVSLTKLDPHATDTTMEWLIRYEDFHDAHSIPFYLQMDTSSIITTAYKYLNDPRPRAKILALQTAALFDKSSKPDSLSRVFIKTWNNDLKGYAIEALSFCNRGNYKSILVPYLNIKNLRSTIATVLGKSPTAEDVEFVKTLH